MACRYNQQKDNSIPKGDTLVLMDDSIISSVTPKTPIPEKLLTIN